MYLPAQNKKKNKEFLKVEHLIPSVVQSETAITSAVLSLKLEESITFLALLTVNRIIQSQSLFRGFYSCLFAGYEVRLEINSISLLFNLQKSATQWCEADNYSVFTLSSVSLWKLVHTDKGKKSDNIWLNLSISNIVKSLNNILKRFINLFNF